MKKGHLHISDKKGINSVGYPNIIRISAKRSSCIIHVEKGENLLVPKSMATVFKDIKSDKLFIQIHRSHIVNLEKVKHYHKENRKVELVNGELITVSKGFKPDFIKHYKRF